MITKETIEKLNVIEEWITFIFDEYERKNWTSNGQLQAIKFSE